MRKRSSIVVLCVLALASCSKTGSDGQAQADAQTHLTKIATALSMFEMDMGRYPTTNEGLKVLVEAPVANASAWKGPYVKPPQIPQDPWGHAYVYRAAENAGSNPPYSLLSCGPDGKAGTADDVSLETSSGSGGK